MRLPPLDTERLHNRLQENAEGIDVLVLHEVSSTNDLARERAASGAPHGSVVVADAQRAGRGRDGRSWESPLGLALAMSTVLRPVIPPERAGLLPLAAGVATAAALESTHPIRVGLKWPNDVMAGTRKLGGILVESATEGDALAWAVVGVGVNLAQASEDFPPSIRDSATSLVALGVRGVDREALVVALHRALLHEAAALETDPARVVPAFSSRDILRGRLIEIDRGGGSLVRGTASGVGPDGALSLETSEGRIEVRAGHVLWGPRERG